MQFAFIYFFNLHLGQGIILLPKLISKTGLLLSTLLITAIAGVNFITSSHVVEAMGIANALNIRQKRGLPNVEKTTDVSLLKMHCVRIISGAQLDLNIHYITFCSHLRRQ